MLLYITEWLSEYLSAFTVFQYLTVRAIVGIITSLVIALLFGPYMIRKLTTQKMGQPIRDDGPKSHYVKSGTPTMGGSLILISIALTTLLWSDLSNRYMWTVLLTTVGFGVIGWCDDYLKLTKGNSKGLSAKTKYFWQTVIGLLCATYIYMSADSPAQVNLLIPFLKDVYIPLGIAFIPFAYLVIVGSSNAVNLTDGLDGLAIMPTVMVAGALGIFVYVIGHSQFSSYLGFPYIRGVGELVIICGSIVGSGLGFLWFNTYPAQVFMGDIGALALGAALGVLAVIARQELVLFVMGGIFVLEAVSVMIQVISFKLTGKRIFRMAPIHHHYELKGWPEPRVIVRFWIITFVLVLIGLATLKIR